MLYPFYPTQTVIEIVYTPIILAAILCSLEYAYQTIDMFKPVNRRANGLAPVNAQPKPVQFLVRVAERVAMVPPFSQYSLK